MIIPSGLVHQEEGAAKIFFRNHESVLKYAKEIGADLVLHGGDFFYRTKIPQMIIAKAYDSLIHFAENNIPIVIVPGNHESSRLPDSLLTPAPYDKYL